MDIQLQELLQTIKSEGVDAAEKKSAEIIAKAEKKANELIAAAEKKAAEIVSTAEAQAQQMEASGKAAIKQAGRDMILSIEQQLKGVFSRLVAKTVSETYHADVLEKAIHQVVTNWASGLENSAVLVNEEVAKELEASLKGGVAQALQAGIAITPSSKVEGGFILQERDGAAYYDFTDSAIAEALAVYLNPTLAAILTGKDG
jgi:V/A-type H+-transporting ATPase subunit E